MFRILYVSNWIAILGSIVFCVIFWSITNSAKPEIIGTIENLSNREVSDCFKPNCTFTKNISP